MVCRLPTDRRDHAAGASALCRWRRERRRRRARLAVALPLVCAGAAFVVAWLMARTGVAPLDVPGWFVVVGTAGLAASGAAAWPRRGPDRWARGAAGELATAAILSRLPRHRWVVLHDLSLPGTRANVDHLVIGPSGVWVVDTKAYRAQLRCRRGKVLVGGVPLATAAVRWEARVVSGLLGVEVRPILAIHGRGLPRRGRRHEGVPVVRAERLPRRLRRRCPWRRPLPRRRIRQLGELVVARLW